MGLAFFFAVCLLKHLYTFSFIFIASPNYKSHGFL
jgi:hypothetical protein